MNTWDEIPKIELYSDGGADPNPGRGGYGVILSWKGIRKEFSEGFKMTTNNRMELLGVIRGLEKLKTKSEVQVFTDSKYVVDGIEQGWARKWKANNWYRTKSEKAINADLWANLLELIDKHIVKFNWVKGHAGHAENERCDQLATEALNRPNLQEDLGYYEQKNQTQKSNGKIEKAGDLCRKCNVPVILKIPTHKKPKEDQSYYYEYYLFCPQCKTMYMVEDAKRFTENQSKLF
jgi:ribonuclease HI